MGSDKNTTPEWIRLSPELEHFDPFEGLVDLAETDAKNIQYGYKICKQNILLEHSIPCEVIQNYTIYPIPNTPKWINGLINHRGNLIPVFDLYTLWSVAKDDEKYPLVIFDTGANFVGIYLDAYPVALDIDKGIETSFEQTTNIPGELSLFIKSVYSIDNTIWSEVDFRGFMRHITRDYSDDETEKEDI